MKQVLDIKNINNEGKTDFIVFRTESSANYNGVDFSFLMESKQFVRLFKTLGWTDMLTNPCIQDYGFDSMKQQNVEIESAFMEILKLFRDVTVSEDSLHAIFKEESIKYEEIKLIKSLINNAKKDDVKFDLPGIVGLDLDGKNSIKTFITAAIEWYKDSQSKGSNPPQPGDDEN